MDLGLQDRRAIVTGGSKGLGRAISEELLREGASVAICARNDEEVAATTQELSVHGKILGLTADVTDPGQVDGFVQQAVEELGGIDILVNNAGRAQPGNFSTLTDDQWEADLAVKLFSMIRCSRAALPHLRQGKSSRIININAVHGRSPHPRFFATSTNRAACLAFSKTLALELAPEGILVNAVNIGFVKTPQWKNIQRHRAPDLAEDEFFERLGREEVPLGRFGIPDEVSGLVAFLAGSRASYITGASIDVAGGMGGHI